jgi:hypothetical protein
MMDEMICPKCGKPMTKMAYLEAGEGWWLQWGHALQGDEDEPSCDQNGPEIAWPFDDDEVKSESQMMAAGFTMAD